MYDANASDVLAASRIKADEAEIEQQDDHGGVVIRAMLQGWELRTGQRPIPALKPFELYIDDEHVHLNLPEFHARIRLDDNGGFNYLENNGRGRIEVNGRVRGQILIVNAERDEDRIGPVALRLTAALPVMMYDDSPQMVERLIT